MNLRKNTPADAVVVDEPAEGSSKKMLVAGGVAAGLAVVAAMSYVLLSGGSDSAETGVVAAAKHTVAQQPTDAPSASSAPAIKKFTGKNARDPFKALVVEPAASTAGASGGAPTSGGAGSTSPTAAPAGGSAPTAAPSSTATTSPATPAPSASTAKSTTVTMVAVESGDTSARIKVDGKTYQVKPLEEFGGYFKLLNLQQSTCGAVQYGDVTFDLCEGESRTFR